MVSSGMTILRALYVLEGQTESKKLRETLISVRKDVEAGLALSDAMALEEAVLGRAFRGELEEESARPAGSGP